MNRLSEYIGGMTLTRLHLREAKVKMDKGLDRGALIQLISAFDAFVAATSCAISIREKKKPKERKRT